MNNRTVIVNELIQVEEILDGDAIVDRKAYLHFPELDIRLPFKFDLSECNPDYAEEFKYVTAYVKGIIDDYNAARNDEDFAGTEPRYELSGLEDYGSSIFTTCVHTARQIDGEYYLLPSVNLIGMYHSDNEALGFSWGLRIGFDTRTQEDVKNAAIHVDEKMIALANYVHEFGWDFRAKTPVM